MVRVRIKFASKYMKDKVLTSLKKARSHLDKIIDMVEADEYCIDVIQQINAVEGYLSSAKRNKLVGHLNSCFVEGMDESKEKRQEYIDEVVQIIKISK